MPREVCDLRGRGVIDVDVDVGVDVHGDSEGDGELIKVLEDGLFEVYRDACRSFENC